MPLLRTIARRRTIEDDDCVDLVEIESRLASYSVGNRAATAEDLRTAFRPPEPVQPEAPRETFTTRFTTESLFVCAPEPVCEPDVKKRTEACVDLPFGREEACAILGVPLDASREEIVRVHRQLALHHHPDRHFHSPEDERRAAANVMSEVNMAYTVLQLLSGDATR